MNLNVDIWNKLRTPPKDALKAITGGRLKGKSDINPTWRMQAMTEVFGPVGMGWAYTIDEIRMVDGSDGQVVCFVRVGVTYKLNGEWSEPIPGVGGSMFIENEAKGPFTNDEAVKMATTDALSVAFKALGVAADVYRGHYDGKQNTARPAEPARQPPKSAAKPPTPPKPTPPDLAPHHQPVVDAWRAALDTGRLNNADLTDLLGSCGFERIAQIPADQANVMVREIQDAVARLGAA